MRSGQLSNCYCYYQYYCHYHSHSHSHSHYYYICCFQNSELTLQSTGNVTVNARSAQGNITGQLFIGNDEVVARNQKFYIKTDQGKTILYADKDNIHFAADKLEFLSKHFIPLLLCSNSWDALF